MHRVLRIQSRICIGGPAHHSMLLSEALTTARGSRYDTLLVGGALEPGEQSLVPEAKARGIRVKTVESMGRPIHPIKDLSAVGALHSLIRKEKPSIVHTHTAKAGAIGRAAAVLARVAVVVHTFHGHVFEGYFDDAVTRRFLRIERILARASDRILVLSQAQRNDIVERYRIAPAHKVEVVPLGLKLDRFRALERGGPSAQAGAFRREMGLQPGKPLLVAIGRLVPIKRLDRLLRAFRQVVRQVPEAHLVIVGSGDPDERSKLEAAAKGDPVSFVGYRRDTDQILADADLLALTSDNEGTPVAVIEALVAGVPVVATDVGGVSDIVPTDAGDVVPREDESELVRALVHRLTHRRPVQVVERDRTMERFSHHRLVRDIEALYDRLLEQERPSRKGV